MTTAVRLCTRHHPHLFARQTPGNDGVWQDMRVVLDEENGEPDWLLCYDEPKDATKTRIPVQRRILFVTEPPGIKNYHPAYLNQFGVLVSPQRYDGFRGVWLQNHGALSWHFGIDKRQPSWETEAMPFSRLSSTSYAEKPFELSVICSNAAKLQVHRSRFEFVQALKDLLGDQLHWYGRGVRDIGDKAEAIAPYRYHIAIENNFVDHFWTEKIADVYLGGAFPFYSGCKNLDEYFSPDAFLRIDMDDPEASAQTIKTAISENLFEKRAAAIAEARRKVLFEYNLYNEVWKVIRSLEPTLEKAPSTLRWQTILPVKSGPLAWFDKRRRAVKNAIRGMTKGPPQAAHRG